ncbi:acyl-CoA dehydrogenase family protein [Pseudonocardia xishanensis]|uniref:Alkylation response protein AidB-like acyl-CoA dehydrogenase n=1 Tax=Pseudonocardia xishanensis TaxID=630995 RepID=A0ABP8RQB3_9PSEU
MSDLATPQTSTLRKEVRAAVAAAGVQAYAECDAWLFGHDMDFTHALAEARLIGLTWPSAFGGREVSNVERLVVTEELLRVGSPVAAHWIADRQIGPTILRHGTPELQEEFLPAIAAGRVTFCLGMSESESGSDLAAVRTRARPVDGGYLLTGRKIWTSHAHRASHAYVLARTGDSSGKKHESLTELIVDMSDDGVEVRPILDVSGEHHFNETIFEDVFVPSSRVIGVVGQGWTQVTEQLSFERGGLERVLSTFPILAVALRDDWVRPGHATRLGLAVSRLHALRRLALTVADRMDRVAAPVRQAAMLKLLGTTFEGEVVDLGRALLDRPPVSGASALDRLVAQGITRSPGATLRGGTTEVLLGIIARGSDDGDVRDELTGLVDSALRDLDPGAAASWRDGAWSRAEDLGWTTVGVPEEAGGSGGTIRDVATIVAGVARGGFSAPIAEQAVGQRAIVETGGELTSRLVVPVLGAGVTLTRVGDRVRLDGRVEAALWASEADELLVHVLDAGAPGLVRVPTSTVGVAVEPGANIAGEPSGALVLEGVELPADAVIGDESVVNRAVSAARVLRSAMLLGAMQAAAQHAVEHAAVREQFGKPLQAFQAVAHHLARMEAEATLVRAALDESLREVDEGGAGWRVVAGQLQAAQAATLVARSAHQVLGAMGMTQEHPLHRVTLRLAAWRDAAGSVDSLASALGVAVASAGPDGLWDWVIGDGEL